MSTHTLSRSLLLAQILLAKAADLTEKSSIKVNGILHAPRHGMLSIRLMILLGALLLTACQGFSPTQEQEPGDAAWNVEGVGLEQKYDDECAVVYVQNVFEGTDRDPGGLFFDAKERTSGYQRLTDGKLTYLTTPTKQDSEWKDVALRIEGNEVQRVSIRPSQGVQEFQMKLEGLAWNWRDEWGHSGNYGELKIHNFDYKRFECNSIYRVKLINPKYSTAVQKTAATTANALVIEVEQIRLAE